MKKKVLSIILATVLIVGMIPLGAIPVSATEAPLEGITNATEIGDLATLQALFEQGGSGCLAADITTPDGTVLQVEPGITVSLCLHGKTLTLGKSSRINAFGTFNLYGNNGGIITGGYCQKGGTVLVWGGGEFNMYSGTIQNSQAYGTAGGTGLGGAVFVEKDATMNMYGGTIKDCTASRYAGAVESYGVFNMYGGTIDNCTATTNNGGGVEAESTGSVTMYGGTIKNCKAMNSGNNAKGGGVSAAGAFIMYGGVIAGCTAYNGGGGVHVYKSFEFIMNGGTIQNCSATYGGGVNYAGTFTMNGGFIDTCTCTGRGGGVYGWNGGMFNLNGGTIQNCTTPNKCYGAGVCLIAASATMSGGTIRNNKTGNDAHGGGVYVQTGEVAWDGKVVPTTAQFTMTGGEISGNYAYWSGGGVFCEAQGSFLMTGGVIKNNTSGSYGSGVGVYQANTSKGNATSWIYIKGGTISGGNTVKKDTSGRAMMWKETVTGSGNCSYNGSYPSSVGVSSYDTLKLAVSGTLTDGSPQVITLEHDITSTGTLTIPYDKNIILNLNGYSLKNSDTSSYILYACRCPLYIVNTSNTKSDLTGGKYALYLYNGGDGYGGSNAYNKCVVHMQGNIHVSKLYIAGDTHMYYDTSNVVVDSYKSGEGNDQRYKITLDANGGSGSPDTRYRAIGSSAYGLPTTAPNREGYTLKGWNSAANGTGTDYGFTLGANGVKTLYAQWSQDKTLSYDNNGHGTAPDAVTMKYTAETTAAGAITCVSGYKFSNWNTKADGTGTAYAAGEQVKAANVDPAATTLYAQWNKLIAEPTAETGLVYNGEPLTGVAEDTGYTVTGGTATDAGNHTATVTLAPGYAWPDGSTDDKQIEWFVAKATVAVPTIVGYQDSVFVYTGTTITALENSDLYAVEDGSATAVGKYTAKIYLNDTTNYEWEESFDGSLNWEIISVQKYNLMNNICECNGKMARQGKIIGDDVSYEIGRTIIPLTKEQLESIENNALVAANDGNKDFTVSLDCAYTFFYNVDMETGEKVKITAEEMDCAAFLIIDNDGLGGNITGFGYYRVYKDAVNESNFMVDSIYAKPAK